MTTTKSRSRLRVAVRSQPNCLVVTVILIVCCSSHESAISQEDVLRPKSKAKEKRVETQDSVVASRVYPQRPFVPIAQLGVMSGLNYNMLARNVDEAYSNSPTRVYEEAYGIGIQAGIAFDYEFMSRLAVGIKIFYETKNVSNELLDVTSEAGIVDPNSGYVVTYKTIGMETEYWSTASVTTLAPYLRWNAWGRLSIQAGPVFQQARSPIKFSTTQRIDASETFSFYDGISYTKSVTVTDEEPIAPRARYGLDVSLSYQVPLSSNFNIVPSLGYQWMASTFTAPQGRMDSSRQYSVGAVPYVASGATLNSIFCSLIFQFVL